MLAVGLWRYAAAHSWCMATPTSYSLIGSAAYCRIRQESRDFVGHGPQSCIQTVRRASASDSSMQVAKGSRLPLFRGTLRSRAAKDRRTMSPPRPCLNSLADVERVARPMPEAEFDPCHLGRVHRVRVGDLCNQLGNTQQTLYRHVSLLGELRADYAKML